MLANAVIAVVFADASGAVGEWNNGDIIAAVLLLVLGVTLGIGLACVTMVLHYMRKGRLVGKPLLRAREFFPRERRATTAVFNLPTRWLAIRSGNPEAVQKALALNNPVPCSWEEGVSAAQDQKLFISPAVRGWVFVMGANLPEPGEDVDRAFRFLMDLSRKVGHVQMFSVNRAVNHHTWAQVELGTVVRAYSWAGRTLWNQGAITRAESDLGLKCFAYGDGEERADYGRPDPAAINTERLPLLAARWSIDPSSIDARMLKEHQGIAGQPSRSGAR